MRIAYVCMDAGIPVYGRKGASVHVQGIVAALLRAGHTVELFAARVGDDRPTWAEAVLLRRVHVDAALDLERRADWITGSNASICTALAAARPFDAVYERYSLWSFGAMEYARDHGIPGILEVNAPLIDEHTMHRGPLDRASAEYVARRVFSAATDIVAVSEEVADYVRQQPQALGKVIVEANGFDPMRFPAHDRNAAAPFTLGFLGTLKPWHGIDILATVYAQVRQRIPDARLLIVGDGPERESLRTRLELIGAGDDIEFAGAVSPEHVSPWLARMDVALAPYPADAPFYFSPLKVVEYMAAGVAVVASDIGQIPSLVDHGVTGLIVPAGDAHACAAACLTLHKSPDVRRALGTAARAAAMSTRTWDAVASRIVTRATATAGIAR